MDKDAKTMESTIKEVNAMIAAGKTKTSIAREMGYKGSDGLYAFIRRKGYIWNQEKNMYIKEISEEVRKAVEEIPVGVAAKVISLFKQGLSAKDIAKQLGFETCVDMGNLMKSKGYQWNMSILNYERIPGHEPIEEPSDDSVETQQEMEPGEQEILQLLYKNREKLMSILAKDILRENIMPRYMLKGVPITKSIHIVNTLDVLAREYSREKNVSQRDIFEIALIDFFNKYGFHNELKVVMNG